MKKKLLILFMLFSIANVYAQKVYHDGMLARNQKCLIIDNNINVRSSPSTSAKKLYKVDAGDEVTILERCTEEMFVEGAWANWYKITCWQGEGYILGRWMTSIYKDCDLQYGYAKNDYIACQFFFRENGNYGFDSGEYIGEDIFFIRQKKVTKLEGISLIKNKTYSIPCTEILIEQETGLKTKEPAVMFIRNFGYGAGDVIECNVCILSDEKILTEICSVSAFWEVPAFKNYEVIFPDVSFDVYNKKWQSLDLLERGKSNEIILICKDQEVDYSGNVIKSTEKKEVFYWNGTTAAK